MHQPSSFEKAPDAHPAPRVHVVDDDPAIRLLLQRLLEGEGWPVEAHVSADEFLAAHDETEPACIIADLRMPGTDGLQMLRTLRGRKGRQAVMMLTGHGQVGLAVEAMKLGAIDFLEKPFDESELLGRVRAAMADLASERATEAGRERATARMASLTSRERDVLALLVQGRTNKEAARHLSISPRTVETYRANIMMKLAADSLAELIRTVILSERPAAA